VFNACEPRLFHTTRIGQREGEARVTLRQAPGLPAIAAPRVKPFAPIPTSPSEPDLTCDRMRRAE